MPAGLRPGRVLLCLKSGPTRDAAAALVAALPGGTSVPSLHNGLANADLGRAVAPALQWLAGMLPFNLAELAPGHLHCGTSGHLAAQDHPALRAWRGAFAAAGLPLTPHTDCEPCRGASWR